MALKAKAEKRADKLISKEDDTLYLASRDEVVSFPDMVRSIYEWGEDTLFQLAGNKGETLDSLGKKTLGQILSFRKRLDGRH